MAVNEECMVIVGGAGGIFGHTIQISDVNLYNVSSNKWILLPELPNGVFLSDSQLRVAFYGDSHSGLGKLVVMQWRKRLGAVYLVYHFNLTGDPSDGDWTAVDIIDPSPLDRQLYSLTTVNYKGLNRAYLFGGSIIRYRIERSPVPFEIASDLWYLQGMFDCFFWTEVSPLTRTPAKVYGHTTTVLGNSVFVFGGYTQENGGGVSSPLLDAWRIDARRKFRGNWEQYHSLLEDKSRSVFGHSAVPVDLGGQMSCLIIYGGFTRRDNFIKESDGSFILVCPLRFIWKLYNDIADPTPPFRILHTAVVHENRMCVFGGLKSLSRLTNNSLEDLWCLDINSVLTSGRLVVWKEQTLTRDHPQARFGHTALLINNNTGMIVFGGSDGRTVFYDTWIYKFRSNEWERLDASPASLLKSPQSVGRFGHVAVVVGTHLIVHGGCTLPPQLRPKSTPWQPLPSCTDAGRSQMTIYLDIKEKKWGVLEIKNSLPLLYHRTVLVEKEIIVYGGEKPDDSASEQLLVMQPSCNPGMQGSLSGIGCDYCPIGTYSEESGPLCKPCNTFFTTNQTGSRSEDNCNICIDICSNGGSCIVKRPNYLYECRCLALFTGPTCGNVGPALGLASGIIGGLVLLYLVVQLVKYFNRVKQDAKRIRERDAYIGDFIEGGRIDEIELTFGSSLGEGAFGEVMLAQYREIQVAVKILHQGPNKPIMGSDTSHLFEQEIDFMRRTRHKNIVLFLGWGMTGAGGLFLVTEYMRRGSLSDVLQTYSTTLLLDRKLKFARDSAEGMRFLHTKGRIHRDLKSANLLVDRNWMVKVADFGSARTLCTLETAREATANQEFDMDNRVDEDSSDDEETIMLKTNYWSMTRRVGTLLYSAPELLSRRAYGAAIDVYRSADGI